MRLEERNGNWKGVGRKQVSRGRCKKGSQQDPADGVQARGGDWTDQVATGRREKGTAGTSGRRALPAGRLSK